MCPKLGRIKSALFEKAIVLLLRISQRLAHEPNTFFTLFAEIQMQQELIFDKCSCNKYLPNEGTREIDAVLSIFEFGNHRKLPKILFERFYVNFASFSSALETNLKI